jgi:hypothetical protein
MARRPVEQSEKPGLPGARHWLIAGLLILALTAIIPFLGILL